jgi:hypothetical protein
MNTDLACPYPHDTKRHPKYLKCVVVFFTLFVVVTCLAVGFDNLRIWLLKKKCQTLKVDDEKSRVISILGAPDVCFPAGPERFIGNQLLPERWVYGKRLNKFGDMFSTEFPWVVLFRFRLSAYEDDIEIRFSKDERVTRIRSNKR